MAKRYTVQLRRARARVKEPTDMVDARGRGNSYEPAEAWYDVIDTEATHPDRRLVCEATRANALMVAAALNR